MSIFQLWGHAVSLRFILFVAVSIGLLLPNMIQAEDRKFVVLLASSPRTSGPGVLPGDLNEIDNQYFGLGNASFREYWNEISYGLVNITDGRTFGNIVLTWSTAETDFSFVDLNDNSKLNPGMGEGFTDGESMFEVDVDGQAGPQQPQPQQTINDSVWTPGERYLDLEGNGVYDAVFDPYVGGASYDWCTESETEHWAMAGECGTCGTPSECNDDYYWYDVNQNHVVNPLDFDPDDYDAATLEYMAQNSAWDPEDWWDFNGNNTKDYPEPYEDFQVKWNGTQYQKISVSSPSSNYITWNYPGSATALVSQTGNNVYNSPEKWSPSGEVTKYELTGGG